MLMLLDILEEHRPLALEEWNGREIVKKHQLNLLEYQSTFWKQRATIRWVKFGDGNTKFFQAKATFKYMNNQIPMILDENL